MNPESQRRLAAIASRWNDVERRMKQIEMLRREALYATINELRYTGRKIADVLILVAENSPDDAAINRELIIADNYLINADHDLTDAAIMFVSLQVQRVIERHGQDKIGKLIPSFVELHSLLYEAKTIVIESRGDRKNRVGSYKRLASLHVPKLIELHEQLIAEPKLAVPDGPINRRLQITTVYAFLGLLAGLASFGVNAWNWYSSPPKLSQQDIQNAVAAVLKNNSQQQP